MITELVIENLSKKIKMSYIEKYVVIMAGTLNLYTFVLLQNLIK